ncbi:GIY-YIG nuclease family protein [Candidatus Woesebacteria bacterium]|nr:GIY-YIG nuclease family protein [Candidatus Woesebacteria bacterium]
MFYVYVLESLSDGKFYTGYTNNIENRLKRHNSGLVKATKYRKPLKFIYYEYCLNRKDAIKRETYLKSAWGKRYIKNRLRNYLTRSQ